MITVICGEDIVSSRNYFSKLQGDLRTKDFEITSLKSDEIFEIRKWLGDSMSLFSQKRAFFIEHLDKKIKKDSKKIVEEIAALGKDKDIEIYDWEELAGRQLKLAKYAKIKEFKPDIGIFKLLDNLHPHNKVTFITQFQKLSADTDPGFIFHMLTRHIRNLILAKMEIMPPKMQSWQFYKLQSLTKWWKLENLVNFYEALGKIEISQKTGKSPYSLSESLDILACYFL